MTEWNCPKDCPNRKFGCQNAETCEIYRARCERTAKIKSEKAVVPYNYLDRSTPTYKAQRKYRNKKSSYRGYC